MRKIYTLFLVFIFTVVASMAQDATIKKMPDGCDIYLDGVAEDFWLTVEAYDVGLQFEGDTDPFSLDVCTWQAVWNDTAIYLLITVEEDGWCPSWCSGGQHWESDKPEIYFDCNVGSLDDGVGPSGAPNGHYQVTTGGPFGSADGWITYDTANVTESGSWGVGAEYGGNIFYYGYVIDDPDETWEYGCVIRDLTSSADDVIDPYAAPIIGFGVTFIDRDDGDAARKRAVWKNTGPTESWANMDNCGEITFSTDEIECATGIYTPQVSNLNVYPNPAMDYLQVEADFNEVVITNIIGQEALILRDVKGTRIDISSLESGLYFISLYNNSKYVGIAKFTVE